MSNHLEAVQPSRRAALGVVALELGTAILASCAPIAAGATSQRTVYNVNHKAQPMLAESWDISSHSTTHKFNLHSAQRWWEAYLA